ncbi:MAG TPA: PDZ domain-containing protein [Gammaproteobacteria bacterium]
MRRLPGGGPASRAGVKVGDRVLAVDGVPIGTLEDFYRRVWDSVRPGERVGLELRREASTLEVEVEAADPHALLRLDHLSR